MYKVGDIVSYGLLGKCVVTGIEVKELSTGQVDFYQIRVVKNAPGGSKNFTLKDAAILIPVSTAAEKGLRPLMTKQDSEEVLKLLADPEYYFELNETWVSKQKKLEEVIRKEGFLGLAKIVGHLYVALKRDAVPPNEVVKFFESVFRVLAREMSESFGVAMKDMDALMNKALKNKLNYDN